MGNEENKNPFHIVQGPVFNQIVTVLACEDDLAAGAI
jgi:hypothetical protein